MWSVIEAAWLNREHEIVYLSEKYEMNKKKSAYYWTIRIYWSLFVHSLSINVSLHSEIIGTRNLW